jgi:hypothetical protein
MSLAVEAAAGNKSGSTAYTRRVPDDTVLYGVVSNQLSTFLSHAEQSGRSVPAFVRASDGCHPRRRSLQKSPE